MTVSSFDMTFTARDGAAYDGRMSTPAGDGTAPAILIIPAIFGTDAEMEGLIEDFARDGFLTAAPDYFHRSVPGPTADFQAALDRMNSFDMAQGLMDMEDCMDQLRSHPRCNGKLAVLGFCFGGSFAFLAWEHATAPMRAPTTAPAFTVCWMRSTGCRCRPACTTATMIPMSDGTGGDGKGRAGGQGRLRGRGPRRGTAQFLDADQGRLRRCRGQGRARCRHRLLLDGCSAV